MCVIPAIYSCEAIDYFKEYNNTESILTIYSKDIS